jgi:hypothetical protein
MKLSAHYAPVGTGEALLTKLTWLLTATSKIVDGSE